MLTRSSDMLILVDPIKYLFKSIQSFLPSPPCYTLLHSRPSGHRYVRMETY